MRKFYIDLQPGVGYVVALLDTDGLDNGFLSNSYVRNFGFRQSDAIEFRNDCNDGKNVTPSCVSESPTAA